MTGQGESRQAGNGQETLIRVLTRAWSYVGAVMGDHDYERYVAHQNARHPGGAVLSERDYWRLRHDEQEANPQGRCC